MTSRRSLTLIDNLIIFIYAFVLLTMLVLMSVVGAAGGGDDGCGDEAAAGECRD